MLHCLSPPVWWLWIYETQKNTWITSASERIETIEVEGKGEEIEVEIWNPIDNKAKRIKANGANKKFIGVNCVKKDVILNKLYGHQMLIVCLFVWLTDYLSEWVDECVGSVDIVVVAL